MAGVKTAISLEKELFNQVNALAKKMQISRSHLFTLAVKEYLKRYENKNLLSRINAAYDDIPTEEERKISQAMKRKQKEIIKVYEPW